MALVIHVWIIPRFFSLRWRFGRKPELLSIDFRDRVGELFEDIILQFAINKAEDLLRKNSDIEEVFSLEIHA